MVIFFDDDASMKDAIKESIPYKEKDIEGTFHFVPVTEIKKIPSPEDLIKIKESN